MKFDSKNWVGIILAALIILVGLIFLRGEGVFYFMIVLALVIAGLPFVISVVINQGKQREKEERFLEFTRDLVGNVKSGTPVSKSILNLRNRDYGALSEHVQKLANQIQIGITLTVALRTFAKDTKSVVVRRAVDLISEAEKAGGRIETILESVSRSVAQTENLRKEQKSAVYNLVVQGYIIFFVFIIIMLVLQFKILPMTADLGGVENLSVQVNRISADDFGTPLLVMLIVQSLFAGLVIGKISEGSLKAGIKHSFILVALALLISTGARAFLG